MTERDILAEYLEDSGTNTNPAPTISRSRDDWEAMYVLQRRQRCIDLIREYRYLKMRNSTPKAERLCVEIQALFDNIRAMYKKDKAKAYGDLANKVYSNKPDLVIQGYYIISEYLEEKNITKIDTRRSYAGMGVADRNDANTN